MEAVLIFTVVGEPTHWGFVAIWMAACIFFGPRDATAGQEPGTKENLDLPFDGRGVPDSGEDLSPESIDFYGQVFEGDGFFFCCDKEGGRFPRLQRELIYTLSNLSEKDQFSLCFFDSNLTRFPGNCRPAQATPIMKLAAITYVKWLMPGHDGKCASCALQYALHYANQSTARVKQIILLSDGMNSCPGADPDASGKMILEEVKRKNVQHVKINTICFGTQDAGVRFMQALAEQNGGRASRVREDTIDGPAESPPTASTPSLPPSRSG
jgi:VWA domain-containing protein